MVQRPRRRQMWLAVGTLVVIVGLLAVLLGVGGSPARKTTSSTSSPGSSSTTSTTGGGSTSSTALSGSTTSTTTTTGVTNPALAGVTTIVSPSVPVPGYARPGGRRVTTVPTRWLGSPLVMPVIAVRAGYFEIRLPERPNGSTTWVRSTGLLISQTPYQIIVSLRTKHLELFKDGKVVMNAPVGVGTVRYPTPVGNFFLTSYAEAPDPGYGPFVMVTSAHSNTITDWQGSGDAIVAIHGPLGADAVIGTSGARVSHGCIRMHVAQQQRLSVVPIGSPITITR